jgi:hypothetical protein
MGCRRAFSRPPFPGRVRIHPAILPRFTLDDLTASLTLIDDRKAAAPVESATLLGHEAALDAAFGGLTNHASLLVILMGKQTPKKTDPLTNHGHGQVGSVIPFPQRRALLSKYDGVVKKKMQKKCRNPFENLTRSHDDLLHFFIRWIRSDLFHARPGPSGAMKIYGRNRKKNYCRQRRMD